MGQSYPLPITTAMLAPANPHVAKPRYDSMTDWHGGVVGNDWDVADATQAIANSGSAQIDPDYEPRHQEEKGSMAGGAYTGLAGDIGIDYGEYTGLTGRDGDITPLDPYPVAPPPEPEP